MTRAVVLAIGAIGLAIVLRAAAFYRGADGLAFTLVLLIGTGLLCGLVEQLRRVKRAAALVAEIDRLPRPATDAAIDGAGAELRGLLRARLGGVVALPAPALFTPYLLGFLVLLGLLGTFLGLFETLRGATQALTASTDVDSLRQGLAGPMVGLTRAFGTSACGVAASGALGFAAVFVRRDEQRVGAALAAYVAGPLQPLTLAARTLGALAELAAQGGALPRAAEALVALVGRLENGEKSVTEARAASMERTEQALSASTARIEQSLGGLAKRTEDALVGTAKAVTEAVTSSAQSTAKDVIAATSQASEALVVATRSASEALAATTRTTTEALAATSEATAQTVARHTERALEAVTTTAREAHGAVKEQATATQAVLVEGARATQTALVESARATQTALMEGAHETKAALLDSATSAQEALALGARRAEAALVASSQAAAVDREASTQRVTESIAALLATLETESQRRGAALSEGVLAASEAVRAALVGAVDTSVGELRTATTQMATTFVARIDGAALQMSSALTASATRGADAFAEALAGRVASDEARAERLESKVDDGLAKVAARAEASLSSFAATLSEATEASGASAAKFREGLDGVLTRLEGAETAALARLEEHRGKVAAVVQEEATRLRVLSEEQWTAQVALLERATSELARRAEDAEQKAFVAHRTAVDELVSRATAQQIAMGTKLDDAARLANDATDLAKGAGIELTAVAEMFTAAVDRYREANDAWLVTLKRMEERLENELRADAAFALDAHLQRTREVFQESLEFQRELFAELRTLRSRSRSGPNVALGEAE